MVYVENFAVQKHPIPGMEQLGTVTAADSIGGEIQNEQSAPN
jgi:hypothetical protein